MKYIILSFLVVFIGCQKKPTISTIRDRGELLCGVNQGLLGFASQYEGGEWFGLDIDICKALAAAVFGDGNKVKFVPVSAKERFDILANGKIDVLVRNSTISLSKELDYAIDFGPAIFSDGQGFLAKKNKKLLHIHDLKGETICVQEGTSNHKNLLSAIGDGLIEAKPLAVEKFEDLDKTLESSKCSMISADTSALVAIKMGLRGEVDNNYVIKGLNISKEPLAPVTRSDDPEWSKVVKWVVYSLFHAEELDINSLNAERLSKEGTSKIKSFLTGEGRSQFDHLNKDWALKVLKAVGNYGEIYDRNLGDASLQELPRGRNALWQDGGLIFSPPFL